MAQINFPDNPSVNDTFTSGDRSWKWNGTTWTGIPSTVPARYFTSTTPPTLAAVGDAWYNTETNRTYVYYDSYWVDTTSSISNAIDASATNSGIVNTGTQTFAGNKYFDGKVVGTTQPNGGSDGGVAIKAPASGTQTRAYLQFVNNGYTAQWGTVSADSSSNMYLEASRVLMPNQPSFLAYTSSGYKAGGSWSEMGQFPNSSGTATAVVQHNIGGHFNASNGYFTAPVSGKYVFGFGGWGSYNGAGNRYATSFYINGAQQYINGSNTSAGDSPLVGSSIVYNLAANDNVRLFMYSSVTMNIGAGSHNAYWFGYFLG